MTDNIFSDNQATPSEPTDTQTNQSWVDRIAQDKGDNFRDPEELAKSLFNANMHIKTLEEEQKKAMEASLKADYTKELLEAMRNQQPAAGDNTHSGNNSGGTSVDTTQIGSEEIKKLVEEAVTDRELSRTREQNISEVSKAMNERFGSDALKEVEKKSQELGIAKEDLEELAAKSPSAFLRLIGEAPVAQTNSIPDNSTNTANLVSNSGKRDWAYYSKLRKENPKLYRTSSVQNQMEQDYVKLGSEFWGQR